MASRCPICGEDSLMFGNIGNIFGVRPFCANEECITRKEGE